MERWVTHKKIDLFTRENGTDSFMTDDAGSGVAVDVK